MAIGAAVLLLMIGPFATPRASAARPVPPLDGGLPLRSPSAGVPSTWPAVYHIATSDPVVFVTIDDGFTRSAEAYADIRARGWPITNFVLPAPLSADPSYFETIGSPSEFGDHTYDHDRLTDLSYDAQRAEICRGRDAVASVVGSRPGWFRAPYGAWNPTTIAAAQACGYPGTVLWDVTVNGTDIETTFPSIQRGDIILLHYLPNLQQSIDTLAATLTRAGLHPARLSSYLPPAFPPSRLGPDTVGVVRGNTFYLRNSDTTGTADIEFHYGDTGDTPIVGDWNGDRTDTVGVVRGNVFYLRNTNTTGKADITFSYGNTGDIPIVGDWNGDGIDTVGVVRGNVFYLRNTNTTGKADITFSYGNTGDVPIVGDWNGDRTDTVGVVRGDTFYLRNTNTTGTADIVFDYGDTGDVPVTGRWVAAI